MMCSKGLLKRLLPFFATFAVGIFIASFFVNVGFPRFRGCSWERHKQMQQMSVENEELRNENLRLKNELEDRGSESSDHRQVYRRVFTTPDGTQVPYDAPMPPPVPVAPKAHR